jgi:hypothetical protein
MVIDLSLDCFDQRLNYFWSIMLEQLMLRYPKYKMNSPLSQLPVVF